MAKLPAFNTFRQSLIVLPVRRVIVALGAWGLFIAYHYINFSSFLREDHLDTSFLRWGLTLKETLAALVGYYFFSWVILPRWLLRRRWLLVILGLGAIYYVWALLSYAFFTAADYYGAIRESAATDYFYRILDKGLRTGVFAWYGVSIGLSDFGFALMPPLLVCFLQFLLTSANRNLRLTRENLDLEVSFLKAQVNPHFLFNTLNNLYTLVIKQDVRAAASIQHLTELMHYTVFESNALVVPLTQEIAFLAAYLELERLRYGQKVRISYQQDGNPANLGITPLLFFPLVENAFKHGIDSSLEASWVEISLTVQGQQVHFAMRNCYSPAAHVPAAGGVGLVNVRKRLALHYVPTAYELTIHQTAAVYDVHLMLHLTSLTGELAVSTTPNQPYSPSLVFPTNA